MPSMVMNLTVLPLISSVQRFSTGLFSQQALSACTAVELLNSRAVVMASVSVVMVCVSWWGLEGMGSVRDDHRTS